MRTLLIALVLMLLASGAAQAGVGTTLKCTIPQDADPWLHVKWVGRIRGAAVKDTVAFGIQDSVRSGAQDSIFINVGCIPPPGQTWDIWNLLADKAMNWSPPSNIVTIFFLP